MLQYVIYVIYIIYHILISILQQNTMDAMHVTDQTWILGAELLLLHVLGVLLLLDQLQGTL